MSEGQAKQARLKKTPAPAKEKVKVTVSQIKGYLSQGLDRREIAAKLGISWGDMKSMFSHPELKGLKKKPTPGFVFVDEDGSEETAEATEDNPKVAETTVTHETAKAEAVTEEKGKW